MKRNLQIDFLRFCGIALVMMHHLPGSNNKVVLFFSAGGWVGVDLFFVLSGYLVSDLIMKEYNKTGVFKPGRFLIRRGFKIYPAYYLLIVFLFFFDPYFIKNPQSGAGFFHEAVFISNYLGGNNGILWSICVEEHFYILLSILFYFLIKLRQFNLKAVVVIFALTLVVAAGCRLYGYFAYTDYQFNRDYTRSHLRFDALFVGVLLSYIANYHKGIMQIIFSPKARGLFIVLSLCFLSSNFLLDRQANRWMAVINLSLNPICFGYIMIALLNFNNKIFLKLVSPLAYIGKYSYSIYLFHILFFGLINLWIPKQHLHYYIFFVIAISGGIMLSKIIEYPFLSIRDRYFPSVSKHPNMNLAEARVK